MKLLQTKSLDISIGGWSVCRDLNFCLEPGQYWGILGGNGIGKTTLLQTLAGLRPSASGEVLIEGIPLCEIRRRDLARKLGVLFQDSHDIFPGSVMETVLIGRHPWLPVWAFEGREDFALAEAALRDVAMDTMVHRQVNTLSGGERRRLALATLLLQDPKIWLLDEPTNHLDMKHQINLLQLIRTRVDAARGGLVMVLHDVNLITRFCSHVILMQDHETMQAGPVNQVVSQETLERLYRHPIRRVDVEGGCLYYPG
ncbi:MAG: ABC transporter [Gammaproteobacteria bacterium RIFCSPLOWO2_02_FULL_56_15]|nr:MAG: ABC transporter [Gammaproteobacteria bacterium RIFCSPLOWO2_02_FULL_56_15]